MKEVNHRVKNSLQIVSGLLHLQAKTAGAEASKFHDAAARVAAIAAVHEQLHNHHEVGTVALDRYLVDLCKGIAAASSSSDQAWPLDVDADPLTVRTDIAVPLALIVNELVTNAIQHSRPVGEGGRVHVVLKSAPEAFSVSVSDPGDGPAAPGIADIGTRHAGLGTRIVNLLAQQIGSQVTRERCAAGYAVTVTVPHPAQDTRLNFSSAG